MVSAELGLDLCEGLRTEFERVRIPAEVVVATG